MIDSKLQTKVCCVEQFSNERRKFYCVLSDKLKNVRAVFSSTQKKQPKVVLTRPHAFSRAVCLFHVFALRIDWITGFFL